MLRAVADCGHSPQEARVEFPVEICQRFSTLKASLPKTWKLRSLDSKRVGKLLAGLANAVLPGVRDCDIVPVLFVPEANELHGPTELGFAVDAESVLGALR